MRLLTFFADLPLSLNPAYSAHFSLLTAGQFKIHNVIPQAATGEASKVKVKVRINLNGIFNVSSATMYEKLDADEEPMDVEGGDKSEATTTTSTTTSSATENGESTVEPAATTDTKASKPVGDAKASGDQKEDEPVRTCVSGVQLCLNSGSRMCGRVEVF